MESSYASTSQEHLTAFYLAMSCGGVLGGLFNALVAPIALRPGRGISAGARPGLPGPAENAPMPGERWAGCWTGCCHSASGSLTVGAGHGPATSSGSHRTTWAPSSSSAWPAWRATRSRIVRSGSAWASGAVLLAGGTYTSNYGRVLYQHRDYFGVLRVTHVASGNYHRLIHGHTLHGQQCLDPRAASRAADLLPSHRADRPGLRRLAYERSHGSNVAHRRAGSRIAGCLRRAGPALDVLRDRPRRREDRARPALLHFSRGQSRGLDRRGPGRCPARLKDAPEHGYGLIVLDAFSSDAIPTHLLTREALRLYRGKLAKAESSPSTSATSTSTSPRPGGPGPRCRLAVPGSPRPGPFRRRAANRQRAFHLGRHGRKRDRPRLTGSRFPVGPTSRSTRRSRLDG